MSAPFAPSRLVRALHPTSAPPQGPGWNHADIAPLLPDGGRNLWAAAVLVGLVDRGAGEQVLLTRRNEGLRHHAGQISFPGGRIEPCDADPVAAALREAQEEIGLAPHQARALGYLDPFATITGFHVYPVVAQVSAEFCARPVELEYRGARRSVLEFQFGGRRVWGATAAMLVNLRERLERSA